MSKIKNIKARQILDSRGNPTIEVDVYTRKGLFRAAVPSGASTGKYEALELRDKDGGVMKAVKNVEKIIAPKLIGRNPTKQKEIDELMIKLDPDKSKLGANAILGVSLAVARAGSGSMPLYKYIAKLVRTKPKMPRPFFNVINGGKHAGNNLAIQEFMIAPNYKTFKENLKVGSDIYHLLKKIIEKKYGRNATNVGDEGGFASPLKKTDDALDLIVLAIKKSGYKKVEIAIDAAASEFYKKKLYHIDGKKFSNNSLIDYYFRLIKKYPIISIEDPFCEDDFESFAELNRKTKIQIVADDLTVTNIDRVQKAIEMSASDCLLLKVNQVGTLSEALEAAHMARHFGWGVMVSHRSGETEDTFIADLAVGLGCGQIKAGAPCRGERTAKYNQLLRIEEGL